MLLSEADAALGRLAGSGRLLPDPHLLVSAYITREAVSSSRIEGTQASVTEVFDAAVTGETKRDDIREVRNYVAALQHGMRRLKDDSFPISLRLIKEMHEILLTGVRGQDRTPGEFRTSQNWINSPDNRPETATFVPPPVHEMWQALDDWEKYLHDGTPRLPLLIRCAHSGAFTMAAYVHANPEDLATARDALAAIYRAEETRGEAVCNFA